MNTPIKIKVIRKIVTLIIVLANLLTNNKLFLTKINSYKTKINSNQLNKTKLIKIITYRLNSILNKIPNLNRMCSFNKNKKVLISMMKINF